MNKYTRTNKVTGKEETFFAIEGIITKVDDKPSALNTDKATKYFRFNADIPLAGMDDMACSGKVFEAFVPHIGGLPEIGKRYLLSISATSLAARANTHWSIVTQAVDSTDALEAHMKALGIEL